MLILENIGWFDGAFKVESLNVMETCWVLIAISTLLDSVELFLNGLQYLRYGSKSSGTVGSKGDYECG